MKKILFIIWSHSLGGGAEALLTTIVNHLNPEKYQIGIIEFYHSTIKKEPVNSNVKIYEPITFEGDKEYQKKLYYVHREPDRMIRKYIPAGYDLYVSFNYQIPSFLLPEGGRNIAWVHGAVFDLAEEEMEEYKWLQRKAFEKAQKIISISDITTKSIQELFPEHTDKLIEIYNAIDIKKVRDRADSITEIELEHPAIICVGRLDDNKNPLRMLDIFRAVFEKNSSLHLYFLGKGELESQVQEKTNEYRLGERVHFLGYIENPFPIIKQADICCMASKSEGFPISLLECVALGVPFISTEVGGARILTNGERCGKIYTTDEEAAILIKELLDKPRVFLEEECEKSISSFGLDAYISKVEKVFDEVLEEDIELKCELMRNCKENVAELEERKYYYRFSENLIPEGYKIVLYGAGDIGTNYYHYIKEKGVYQLVAWVDEAAEKYRSHGKTVEDIETIFRTEYDLIIIAVMEKKLSQIIRNGLCKKGISEDKIVWTRPIF